jgi:hypothetical protein
MNHDNSGAGKKINSPTLLRLKNETFVPLVIRFYHSLVLNVMNLPFFAPLSTSLPLLLPLPLCFSSTERILNSMQ